ncbi:MAG: hypothetical protein MJZ09_08395 [Bacteroidales bacterium]|nr:hypothetical protein [Bacteroidales bacterium]
MADNTEFEGISPYSDEEAVAALSKMADHPMVYTASKILFPDQRIDFLSKTIKSVESIDDFQKQVMSKAVVWDLENTAHNFSYDGISNISPDKKHLFLSNHRDIILDPAITQYVFFENGLPMTEICVGDNLLANKYVEALLRSNRMIKVIRGISARELYNSSQLLSRYIRQTITSGEHSVWLAQKQGRAKNGIDATEQGLLKMLDMSGTADFKQNFSELGIIPLSISYEYEPCDSRKAREMLISRTQKYVKSKNEDMHSILIGIRQKKGNIHLNIGSEITIDEIENAAMAQKNDRYQAIKAAVDRRVVEGYKLWHTNYVAYDMLNKTTKYSDYYTKEQYESFEAYMHHKFRKIELRLDRVALREIFLGIYANPVISKEKLFLGPDSE